MFWRCRNKEPHSSEFLCCVVLSGTKNSFLRSKIAKLYRDLRINSHACPFSLDAQNFPFQFVVACRSCKSADLQSFHPNSNSPNNAKKEPPWVSWKSIQRSSTFIVFHEVLFLGNLLRSPFGPLCTESCRWEPRSLLFTTRPQRAGWFRHFRSLFKIDRRTTRGWGERESSLASEFVHEVFVPYRPTDDEVVYSKRLGNKVLVDLNRSNPLTVIWDALVGQIIQTSSFMHVAGVAPLPGRSTRSCVQMRTCSINRFVPGRHRREKYEEERRSMHSFYQKSTAQTEKWIGPTCSSTHS